MNQTDVQIKKRFQIIWNIMNRDILSSSSKRFTTSLLLSVKQNHQQNLHTSYILFIQASYFENPRALKFHLHYWTKIDGIILRFVLPIYVNPRQRTSNRARRQNLVIFYMYLDNTVRNLYKIYLYCEIHTNKLDCGQVEKERPSITERRDRSLQDGVI